jgi:crotonobetaine/carnitine-CoA ligase
MDQRTLPSVLGRGAESWPDKLALRSPTESYTYAELLAATLRVAGGLESFHVDRQEAVLAMLDNHLDFVVTFAGIAMGARMVVPVNTAYKGGILAHVINDSGARVLVVEDRYCERLAAIAGDLQQVSTVFVRGGDGSALEATGLSVFPFEALTTAEPAPIRPVAPSDLYGIVYTSGTTGPSKGVLVTHAGAYSHFHPAHVGATVPDDVNLVVLPMFHTAGQWAGVYNSLISGATAVVLPGFHASTFWDDVHRFGCTYTVMVGAMANFLNRQPPNAAAADNPLRRITMVPVIPEVEDFKNRFQLEVGTCYGLSESSTPLIAPFGTARPKACGGSYAPTSRHSSSMRTTMRSPPARPVSSYSARKNRGPRPWGTTVGRTPRPSSGATSGCTPETRSIRTEAASSISPTGSRTSSAAGGRTYRPSRSKPRSTPIRPSWRARPSPSRVTTPRTTSLPWWFCVPGNASPRRT